MRLGLVLSLLVGVAALLTVVQRLPIAESVAGLTSKAGAGPVVDTGRSMQIDRPRAETPRAAPAVRGRLYRWRDDDGAIHLQTDPPPAGMRADVITYVRQQAQGAAPAPTAGAAPDIAGSIPDLLSVYTPQGFDDLIRRVEETAIELRNRAQYVELLEEQL